MVSWFAVPGKVVLVFIVGLDLVMHYSVRLVCRVCGSRLKRFISLP